MNTILFIEANNGAEAITILKERQLEINLVILLTKERVSTLFKK